MANAWTDKGCPICRAKWERGDFPPELAVNIAQHLRLHRCEVCGTYWQQAERYADTISPEEARRIFPQAFAG